MSGEKLRNYFAGSTVRHCNWAFRFSPFLLPGVHWVGRWYTRGACVSRFYLVLDGEHRSARMGLLRLHSPSGTIRLLKRPTRKVGRCCFYAALPLYHPLQAIRYILCPLFRQPLRCLPRHFDPTKSRFLRLTTHDRQSPLPLQVSLEASCEPGKNCNAESKERERGRDFRASC